MKDEDGHVTMDDIERMASTLHCGERLIQLHRLHDAAPSDTVMMSGMGILRFIQESGMVEPGLFPDLEEGEYGGMSLEWSLRRPSGAFEIITLDILTDGTMRMFRLPENDFTGEERTGAPLDEVYAFLKEHIPEDDDM